MSELIILRGVPGSGKSTSAAALESIGYRVVNRDKIREFLSAIDDFTNEDLVTTIQTEMISNFLVRNYNVVVDDTNVNWNHVKGIAALGRFFGAEVSIMPIDVDLDEALRRNAARDRVVPEHVIRRMHAELETNKDWTL